MHLYKVTFSYEAIFYVIADGEEKALELGREKLKEACAGSHQNYDFESLKMVAKKPIIQEQA